MGRLTGFICANNLQLRDFCYRGVARPCASTLPLVKMRQAATFTAIEGLFFQFRKQYYILLLITTKMCYYDVVMRGIRLLIAMVG